jgi:hypothetical protein
MSQTNPRQRTNPPDGPPPAVGECGKRPDSCPGTASFCSAHSRLYARTGPLSINGPKNNDKKMKWPVEAIGILVLQDVLLEEEWEAHQMRFSSIRL